jgi:hypothetical protein
MLGVRNRPEPVHQLLVVPARVPDGHDPLFRPGATQAQGRPAVLHRLRYLRAGMPDGVHFARTGGDTRRGKPGGGEGAGAGVGARPSTVEAGDPGLCRIAGDQDRWKWQRGDSKWVGLTGDCERWPHRRFPPRRACLREGTTFDCWSASPLRMTWRAVFRGISG